MEIVQKYHRSVQKYYRSSLEKLSFNDFLYLPAVNIEYASNVIGSKLKRLENLTKTFKRYKNHQVPTTDDDDDLLYAYASLS